MTGTAMSSSSKVPKLAIVVVAAVAVTLSAAASAWADRTVSVAFDDHLRAQATYVAFGDWLKVCDRRRDNLPVVVRFSYIRKNGTRQTGSHWHRAGVDGLGNRDWNGMRFPGCSYGNHDFGEGRSVWLQACARHPGGALTCGETVKTGT
jgi:hypothetical protein